MTTTKGRFIVLEGVDGAGTTTQRERLSAFLTGRGFRVHPTAEPSSGPVGRLIRGLLAAPAPGAAAAPFSAEAMALLFAADRRDHLLREVEPQLLQGAIVLSDRYVLSSLAYQTAAGAPRPFVHAANFGGSGIRTPDLTLFVDVPASLAAKRRAQRAGAVEIYDDLLTQERVAAAYRAEVEAWAATGAACEIIDGSGTPDEVEAALLRPICRLLSL